MSSTGLAAINDSVVLMLENRSFDHMLGFLYADHGNVSPAGQAFDGLTGKESNRDSTGKAVPVFKIQSTSSHAYFMPGADPGEGYSATNSQLFGTTTAAAPPQATNSGFVTDFAYTLGWEAREGRSILAGTVAKDIMGMFTPQMLPVLSGLARGFAVCDRWSQRQQPASQLQRCPWRATDAVPPDNSVGEYGFDFKRFGLRVPTVLVSPLIAPGMGAVVTLTKARTDDPLQGVTVPQAKEGNPHDQGPSHLQQVHAQQVAQLPVPDARGGTHHEMPVLRTGNDYRTYIKERVSAWKAARARKA